MSNCLFDAVANQLGNVQFTAHCLNGFPHALRSLMINTASSIGNFNIPITNREEVTLANGEEQLTTQQAE